MTARLIGYARVSTEGQSLDAQVDQLSAAGCSKIFQEKISGATLTRPALTRLLSSVSAGDSVVVSRLDRLARSTRDLLVLLDRLSTIGVSFRSLNDPWANTADSHGRLLIAILGGMAEFERSLIISRTSEGRQRAKAAGVRFGRKPKLNSYQQKEALRRRDQGEPVTVIARSYGVSHSTICRLDAARQLSPVIQAKQVSSQPHQIAHDD